MNEELAAFLNPAFVELAALPIAHAGVTPPEPAMSRNILYGYAQDQLGFSPAAAELFVDNIGLETGNQFKPRYEAGNKKYDGSKEMAGRGFLQFTGESTRLNLDFQKREWNARLDQLLKQKKITQEEYDKKRIDTDFWAVDFSSIEDNLKAFPLWLKHKAEEAGKVKTDADFNYDKRIWENPAVWWKAMNSRQVGRDIEIKKRKDAIASSIQASKALKPVTMNGKTVMLPQWQIDYNRWKEDRAHYLEHKKKEKKK